MFTYCGNNPVRFVDPSGCAYFDIFAVCFGDSGQRKIAGETDGTVGSEALREYIIEHLLPSDVYAVTVNVTHSTELYEHTNLSSSVGSAATVIGFSCLTVSALATKLMVAAPNWAPILAAVSAATTTIGNVCTTAGMACWALSHCNTLPDGEYEQYTVSASWTSVTQPYGNQGGYTYTTYNVQLTYLRVPGREAYWYLLDSEHHIVSKTYP